MTSQTNTCETERTVPVNDKLIKLFDTLPAETKWWIRFYMQLNCAMSAGWPDDGLLDSLNDVVIRRKTTEGFPKDHPNADWLQGIAESVEAINSEIRSPYFKE